MRRVGALAARAGRYGLPPPRTPRSFNRRALQPRCSSTRSSAPRIRGSWSQTAGTATPISIRTGDRCAGHTSNVIFTATPTAWASRRPSASTGSKLTRRVFSAWRAYQHEHHDRPRLQAEIAPIQQSSDSCSKKPARRAPAPAGTGGSRTTCSRSGRRSGPSRAWSTHYHERPREILSVAVSYLTSLSSAIAKLPIRVGFRARRTVFRGCRVACGWR